MSDNYVGWTCGKCGGNVSGPYSPCPTCGFTPERQEKKSIKILYKDVELKKRLMKKAESLWKDLQENNLGGYSDLNRPFYIYQVLLDVYKDGAKDGTKDGPH